MKSKKRSSKSSAETVASIDDLLTEILLRLPVKSLIRSKLVSKHWQYLITGPGFRVLLNPNPNPAIGLFVPNTNFRVNPWYEYVPFTKDESITPPFKKLKFTKDRGGIMILHSCNGLLLCCSSRARDCNRRYYVYNPTTRRFSNLPKLDEKDGITMSLRGMSLVFDPAKSFDHYKVVCVRAETQDGECEWQNQIEIYSSETGSWSKRGKLFKAQVDFENGVFWNNAIHWIHYYGNHDSLYINPDDDIQVFEVKKMPPISTGWLGRRNYHFGESCDHLHYVDIAGPQIQFNVYEMKRDYSEWFVKYRVDVSPVVEAYPRIINDKFEPGSWLYYSFTIFCLVRGQKEEDSVLVLQIPGKIIRYNLVSKTFEIVHEFEGAEVEGSLKFPDTIGFQHIESLCHV